MFCEWDKDLQLNVAKQPANSNIYELSKDKPYTIKRTYNGSTVGYMGSFSSKSEAELYLLHYATT